jgi:Eukaryotic aspartyl protease
MVGVLDEDRVTTAGITVPDQVFGGATQLAQFFKNQALDGILGLAFPAIAADHVTPVFDMMIHEKLLDSNEFTFFLDSTDASESRNSILEFGGSSFYSGSFRYVPVPRQTYWTVDMTGMKVGNTVITDCSGLFGCSAIVDSGTSRMSFPPKVPPLFVN